MNAVNLKEDNLSSAKGGRLTLCNPEMMPGFVEVNRDTFYTDIWPQIKDDVEIIECNRYDAKKGVRPVTIKWGYKEDIKEKVIVAIGRLDATGEKFWVVPALICYLYWAFWKF